MHAVPRAAVGKRHWTKALQALRLRRSENSGGAAFTYNATKCPGVAPMTAV